MSPSNIARRPTRLTHSHEPLPSHLWSLYIDHVRFASSPPFVAFCSISNQPSERHKVVDVEEAPYSLRRTSSPCSLMVASPSFSISASSSANKASSSSSSSSRLRFRVLAEWFDSTIRAAKDAILGLLEKRDHDHRTVLVLEITWSYSLMIDVALIESLIRKEINDRSLLVLVPPSSHS